jgi:DNA-binding phage protein
VSEYDYIGAIRKAATKRGKAKQQMRTATDELRTACLQAKHAGVSISQIAREADLSRQGVYDLLSE